MTTKRKPVLPHLAATLADHYKGKAAGTWESAVWAEMMAAEAVIRDARRLRAYWARMGIVAADPLVRSLARLDKLTRPTRRTP